jgi:tRNA modification GTPase
MKKTDTIIALASAPGVAGVAVLRLSGPQAFGIAHKLHDGAAKAISQPRMLILGDLKNGKTLVDRAMMVAMPAPHSYTGEDVVEFQTHGSPAVVRLVLEAATAAGARLAEPGEFTKRAYLHGQLDLAQAEAVADVIHAETSGALSIAQTGLSGELSQNVEAARAGIVELVAELSAWLDFSEEDLAEIDRGELDKKIEKIGQEIYVWIKSAKQGALLRDGAVAAIIGLPNAGKSSLLNALAGYDRAIVTNIPGTTRDSLEERIEISGLLVRLVDTAGITESSDLVESMGVERARATLQSANVILLCASADQDMSKLKQLLIDDQADLKTIIGVQTKIDEHTTAITWPVGTQLTVTTSAKTGQGLDQLREALASVLMAEHPTSILVANGRHLAALEEGIANLVEAQMALKQGMSLDIVAGQLTLAAESLSTILGVSVDREVINAIFSRFCIGK